MFIPENILFILEYFIYHEKNEPSKGKYVLLISKIGLFLIILMELSLGLDRQKEGGTQKSPILKVISLPMDQYTWDWH